MPLAIVKILSDDDTGDLDAKVTAYKGAAGAELLDTQRAMAAGHFEEVDGDPRTILALAHGGLDTPATGAKTADLQHVVVRSRGSEAEMQADVDAALAAVVHATVTDGDADAVANNIASATGPFAAEDVGRNVSIGGEVREITAFVAATSVTYDGVALTGTSLTVELLGAEVVQALDMQAMKKDAKNEMLLAMACEGELY
jgi:hypothetical protein